MTAERIDEAISPEREIHCHFMFDLGRHTPQGGYSSAYKLVADRMEDVPSDANNIRPLTDGELVDVEYNLFYNWPFRRFHDHTVASRETRAFGFSWVQTRDIAFGYVEGVVWKIKHRKEIRPPKY